MPNTAESIFRFQLGAHSVEVRAHDDDRLSLWLDGCERKQRGGDGGPVYLWTNVELPFEDHHLVEVRRADPAAPALDVRVNGCVVACT